MTADAILAYVYAALHAPEYRERYAPTSRASSPASLAPADPDTFDAFADASQQLLDLHIG